MAMSTTDRPTSPTDEMSAPQLKAISDRLVVMLGHERSGTHFVADMLKSPDKLVSVDEVCNFNAIDPYKSKLSFFRFRHEHLAKNNEFSYRPDTANLTAFCDSYFSHLLNFAKADNVLVDIKYGHVHNFEVGWWPSEHRPFLAGYLERRNVRILHLVRQDSIAATISNFLAEQTGAWHKRSKDPDCRPMRFKAPCQKIVHDALTLEREKDNFFNWLSTNRCSHVLYEDCSNDARRRDAMNAVCRFLGLDERPEYNSAYRKVTPALEDVVENYGDLQRAIVMFGQGRLRTASSE